MKPKLDWLDVLRFMSAIAVVLFHYLANHPRRMGLPVNSIAEYGYLGVEVFFLISGFVILLSAVGRRPDEFAVARAIRLWPTFALCVTITAVVLILRGDHVDFVRYLANLTMIPAYLSQKPLDGVYWTMAYELVFYAAVFIILLLGQIGRIQSIILGWVAMLVLWRVFDLPPVPLLSSYFELFAGGCVLALLHRKPDRLLWLALIACAAMIGHDVWIRALQKPVEPWIAALATVSVIPLFFIKMPAIPFARHFGRTTYPLYLLHNQIGFTLIALGLHWILTTAAVVVLAWAVYRFAEEPTENLRFSLFDRLLGGPIRLMT